MGGRRQRRHVLPDRSELPIGDEQVSGASPLRLRDGAVPVGVAMVPSVARSSSRLRGPLVSIDPSWTKSGVDSGGMP
jgi:hypothetical protein